MGNEQARSNGGGSGRRIPAERQPLLAPEWRGSLSIPARWLLEPRIKPADEICLFVTFAPGGRILEHSLHLARGWAGAGFRLVVVVVTDDLDQVRVDPLRPLAAGILVRRNEGYDFGAWAAAINGLPSLRRAALLAIVNDSVYGPLDSFPAFVAAVRAADADVIGATESLERCRHLQSYCLFFRPRALRSRAFRRFWRRVRTLPKTKVIRRYEIRLLGRLENAGLRCTAIFPAGTVRGRNPTLRGWRGLIEAGFPFLKIKLVRDGPPKRDISGWANALARHGYDPLIVCRHLGVGLNHPEPQEEPPGATEPEPAPVAAPAQPAEVATVPGRAALLRGLIGGLARIDRRRRGR